MSRVRTHGCDHEQDVAGRRAASEPGLGSRPVVTACKDAAGLQHARERLLDGVVAGAHVEHAPGRPGLVDDGGEHAGDVVARHLAARRLLGQANPAGSLLVLQDTGRTTVQARSLAMSAWSASAFARR